LEKILAGREDGDKRESSGDGMRIANGSRWAWLQEISDASGFLRHRRSIGETQERKFQ
jgi:hypothetical protein